MSEYVKFEVTLTRGDDWGQLYIYQIGARSPRMIQFSDIKRDHAEVQLIPGSDLVRVTIGYPLEYRQRLAAYERAVREGTEGRNSR